MESRISELLGEIRRLEEELEEAVDMIDEALEIWHEQLSEVAE